MSSSKKTHRIVNLHDKDAADVMERILNRAERSRWLVNQNHLIVVDDDQECVAIDMGSFEVAAFFLLTHNLLLSDSSDSTCVSQSVPPNLLANGDDDFDDRCRAEPGEITLRSVADELLSIVDMDAFVNVDRLIDFMDTNDMPCEAIWLKANRHQFAALLEAAGITPLKSGDIPPAVIDGVVRSPYILEAEKYVANPYRWFAQGWLRANPSRIEEVRAICALRVRLLHEENDNAVVF